MPENAFDESRNQSERAKAAGPCSTRQLRRLTQEKMYHDCSTRG